MKFGKVKNILSGAAVGVLNGLLGAGGGIIAVILLNRAGLKTKEAHATAIAVILPLTIISAAMYLWRGDVTVMQAVPFMLPGAVGAVAGALILRKISPKLLRKIFAVFIIWAGIRMILK